jgi:hypothetical protein
MDTARNTPLSCYRYYMVKVEHSAAFPGETVMSTLRSAMAEPK